MKNIHVLKTDKPSRLIHNDANQLCYQSNKSFKNDRKLRKKFNIYITSDEEIKEGDWYFDGTDLVHKKTKYNDALVDGNKNAKKIILTTDKDLIKDGVQAIDDEFLEWFVKNPNCESVEIEKQLGCVELDAVCDFGGISCPNAPNCLKNKYKIIIPKEEPKLKNICIKCGVDLYATEGRFVCQKHLKECKGIYLSKETLLIHATEQKQHLINMMKADEELGLYEEPKQEKSYSEEDMKLAFETGRNFQLTGENNFKELIKQFKK